MYCLSLEFERSTKKWIGPSTRFYVHNFGRLRTHYQLKTPYRGSVPGPRWGPQTPSLVLCPPNNTVRSTPLMFVVFVEVRGERRVLRAQVDDAVGWFVQQHRRFVRRRQLHLLPSPVLVSVSQRRRTVPPQSPVRRVFLRHVPSLRRLLPTDHQMVSMKCIP